MYLFHHKQFIFKRKKKGAWLAKIFLTFSKFSAVQILAVCFFLDIYICLKHAKNKQKIPISNDFMFNFNLDSIMISCRRGV